MGVTKFYEITNKNVLSDSEGKKISDLGEDVKLENLSGLRIAIDASTMIYQALLALQFVSSLTDSSGKPTGHINTIFNKILMLKKANVEQVWVFDSPEQNELKKQELAKRDKRRENAKDDKQAFKMAGEHVKDIQDLLEAMGVLYIVAPPGIEAEQYAALMTQGDDPFCSYVMSGDSDVLLFGGNLLRPMTQKSATGKSKKTVYATYNIKKILTEFDITREQLVTMGVAMGSDFAPKTPRIGPSSVHNALRKNKLTLTTEQQAAHDYFMSSLDTTSAEIHKSKFDREKLVSLLVKRGFKEDRITKLIDAAYS